MDVILRPTAGDAVALAARIIADSLRKKPDPVLGLATGRTMEPVYERLVEASRSSELDFSSCRFFALDEYIGLEASDPGSYRHYLDHHLFRHIGVGAGMATIPDGSAPDPKAAAAAYEQAIADAGGIDLQLLGIGENGHIGFNEPGSSLGSRTRDITLARETLAQNAGAFGDDPEKVPRRALTMGVGTILESGRCLLLATGESKARALAAAVEGPITSMVPATALQLHPSCVVIADEAAGAALSRREHYASAFERDPEWAPYRPDGGTES